MKSISVGLFSERLPPNKRNLSREKSDLEVTTECFVNAICSSDL